MGAGSLFLGIQLKYPMISNLSSEKPFPACGFHCVLAAAGIICVFQVLLQCTKDAGGSHQAPLVAVHERNGGDQVTATAMGKGHGKEELDGETIGATCLKP